MNAPTRPVGLARGLTNYGDADFSLYLRRTFAKQSGLSSEMLKRPVVGIAQSASGFNPCHRTTPELVEAIKRGVLAAGGLPLDFPSISLGESFQSPTSMKFRNLMSMDIEEMVRSQPMDAVVLVGGCDKSVPAQLMGAASADIPAIQLVVGPMLPMPYQGERLGACTDCRRFWGKFRAGEVSAQGIEEVEGKLAVTAGTCGVMGTASTMASIAEALGMSLPGTAAIPAVHSDRIRAAEASGKRAAELALAPIRPSEIITEKSVENALRVLLAISGYLFSIGVFSATTQTIAWMVIFFFASPAASAAYLTVSETFPIEVRALAIAVFYAIGTAIGGVAGPALFGVLIDSGSRQSVFAGYLLGAFLMIAAAIIGWRYAIAAERQPLESVARPLAVVE